MPSEPARLPTVTPSRDGQAPRGAEPVPGDGQHLAEGGATALARQFLAAPGEAHNSALMAALEEARGALRRLRTSGNGRADRVAEELGGLAGGPLDAERFAVLLDRDPGLDPSQLEFFDKAVSVLEWATDESARVAEVSVSEAETLAQVVDRTLRQRGRAFGAVRALALLRTGEFRASEHARLLEGLPWDEWRSVEREVAPPLVVSARGSQLDTLPALAPFLDGRLRMILLVDAPASPAPLARLIAPGTLVMQVHDPSDLERLSGFPGPAVAALMPESCASFIHDPRAGEADDDPSPALEILSLPDAPPRRWIGGTSPLQQARDLDLLRAWSRMPAGGGAPSAGSPGSAPPDRGAPARDAASEPAERLASWLLSQARLDDVEQG
jgi:hypothetical protein